MEPADRAADGGLGRLTASVAGRRRYDGAVCITGMHRSGTSMVTGWLASCGLPVDHGRLLGPGKANPKGHFEDLDFVDLQAVVVSRNDPDSLGWKVEEPVRLSFDEAERATAEQLLAERNAAYPAWAWKDPRSLHFLDEWLAVDPSIRVIMLWRPAADVAASLRRREAIGPPAVQLGRYDPLRMWTASNQLAVDWKRAHPDALLLSLDDVVADDRRAFDLIGMSELTYQPLASTYDVELLRRGAPDLADPLEAELARLSDR